MSERGPKKSLKNLWQEAGVPPWERERAPFVWHGEELIAVLGVGIDYEWRASEGKQGLSLMLGVR